MAPPTSVGLLDLSDDVVTLTVGPDEKKFVAQRSAVMKVSPVMRAAFENKAWKEGQEQAMSLPEDDSEAFHLLLHFAYTGQLLETSTYIDQAPTNFVSYGQIAKAFCVGENSQAQKFKNALIDLLIVCDRLEDSNRDTWSPGADPVRILYNGTSGGSPVRRLLVDMWVISFSGKIIRDDTCHPDFLADLAAKLLDDRRASEVTTDVLGFCDYHEHDDGKRCTKDCT